jgi:hypothetical protein
MALEDNWQFRRRRGRPVVAIASALVAGVVLGRYLRWKATPEALR